MTLRRRKVNAWEWECGCERCGHAWKTIRPAPPSQCPGCGARNWNKPARAYVRKKAKPA